MKIDAIRCDGCDVEANSSDACEGWNRFCDQDLCPDCSNRIVLFIGAGLSNLRLPVSAVLQSIEEVEREHIKRVLHSMEWNKSRSAKILGIERSTLDRKLKSWCIPKPIGSIQQ